jgi:hypothetical protein
MSSASEAKADIVLDWNATIRNVVQHEGTQPVHQANPGWSTRAIAMVNTAIYDAFQAVNRTHKPWLVNTHALPNTSLEAAVHQAAYEILNECYATESVILQADYNARMALIPNGVDKTNGIALGSLIAAACMQDRDGDGSADMVPYSPQAGPGKWRPDPWNPGQTAWGPGWRAVNTFGIPDTASFVAALPPIPDMTSQAYTDAYNEVKDYGALNSAVRTQEQTEIGLFWAYDRPSMGPPPVLFIRHLEEIVAQAGNTPEQNARLFAMASVSMADAAISAWDAKFEYNFWRPVAAIQEGDTDGNANTVADPTWRPLGAPGDDPNSFTDDFTPPFPAWTSGHATMGGALFKSLELFYGTNSFDAIDGILGNDPDFALTSEEPGSGGPRTFTTFTQTAPLGIGAEDSPEGENGTSRIYLGLHWIFDQRDGITLGNNIAQYIAGKYFQAIPEPSGAALFVLAIVGCATIRRRSTKLV